MSSPAGNSCAITRDDGGPENERTTKKQKLDGEKPICTMRELLAMYQEDTQTSLLEKLRKKPIAEDPADCKLKMKLILQNKNHFPSKLQRAIRGAKCRASLNATDPSDIPVIFVWLVRKAVEDFIFGVPIRIDSYQESDHKSEPENDGDESDDDHLDGQGLDPENDGDESDADYWDGPDTELDTEDEIELSIRLFPSILKIQRRLDLDGMKLSKIPESSKCIFFLAMHTEAVPFIPLFADLAVEFDVASAIDFDLLREFLIQDTDEGTIAHPSMQFLTKEFFNEKQYMNRYKNTLPVVVRLQEKGFLSDIFDIGYELGFFFCDTIDFFGHTGFGFVERVLRLVVELYPEILGTESRPKILFGDRYLLQFAKATKNFDIRLYRLILELGILYNPKVLLGCGFHNWHLNCASRAFGAEEVIGMMYDVIKCTLANSSNKRLLESWVIEAATNELIHLEGLYTLIRFDPGTLMNTIGAPYKTS